MKTEAISFKDVSFGYGTPDAGLVIDALNLTVRTGECLALMGPSGCGKSTVLRLAAGLLSPTSGTVEGFGEPVAGPHPHRLMVFQEPRLLPWLSVLGNIRLSADVPLETAERYLGMVGLDSGVLGLWPRELSGGMAQRISLVRALVMEPRAMLLDEPLGALDIATRMAIQEVLLHTWKASGCTALLVTHDMEEAVFLGDRVAVIGSDGRFMGTHEPHVVAPGSMRRRDSEAFAGDLNALRSLIASGSTNRMGRC